MNDRDTYVLMTAAHNEEDTIGTTIESVSSSTALPKKWVIVSDGSEDKTDEIIQAYARRYSWIKYLRLERDPGRDFASKIIALHWADRELKNEDFSLIGNIDADITVEPTYFARLIDRLTVDQGLGIVSGFVYEQCNGQYVSRPLNSEQSVPHAAQLVRRPCYESIGGYAVLKFGGEDWHALVSAQMRGWRVESFPDLRIFHHRPSSLRGRMIRNSFREGRMDYSFGSYPPFEAIKCMRRFWEARLTGGVVRMAGFLWGYLIGERRPVSDEFVAYLRKEQKERVLVFIKKLFGRSSRVSRSSL